MTRDLSDRRKWQDASRARERVISNLESLVWGNYWARRHEQEIAQLARAIRGPDPILHAGGLRYSR